MNSTELLTVLSVQKNKETLNHATRLLAVYSLIRSIKDDITEAKVTARCDLMFGKKTEYRWGEIRTVSEGYKLSAENINVKTEYGEYNFVIPVKNDFHTLVCNMLQIEIEKNEAPEISESFEIEKGVIEKIKIAAKYATKKPDFPTQESFKGVLINIENEWAEVVGSDCTRIFVSEKLVTDSKNRKLLISPISFKALAGVVPVGDFCRVDILKNGCAQIDGVKIELMSEVYANYRAVIPLYTEKMVFDRKEFILNVKKVLHSANQYSHLIKLHINGTIEMTAQDIDFGLAAVSAMEYDFKEFDDLDIGFIGVLIQDVLNGFKSEKISMLPCGEKRAVLFTDGVDMGLLMPMNLYS